jgi:K+-sensing histidine kinase KdpD
VSFGLDGPLGDAVTRRSSVFFDSVAQLGAEYGGAAVESYGANRSGAIVPLVAGGRVVAVLRLDFGRVGALTADDRQFLSAIAPRAAQALDRTTQYEAAQRARAEAERERARADEELAERQRVEVALRASETRYRGLAARTVRLHELSTALSDAVSLDAVARALVHFGKVVVGATASEVTLLRDNGTRFETVCSEDGDGRITGARERVPVAAGLCATAAVEGGLVDVRTQRRVRDQGGTQHRRGAPDESAREHHTAATEQRHDRMRWQIEHV